MNADHLAKEAERLKDDPIFNNALDDICAETFEALATADADDKTMILRLQQKVAVIEEIRATLDRYIMAQEAQETAGSFA